MFNQLNFKAMGIYTPTSVSRETRKSIGFETYCKSRGIRVVKAKITTNTSNTEGQQRVRAAWPTYLRLATLFAEAAQIGFPQRSRALTVYNAFIRANKGAVSVDEDLQPTVDYEQVVCSEGSLKVPAVTATLNEGTLSFVHEAEESGVLRDADDQLYAFVVNDARDDAKLYPLNTRGEGDAVQVPLPTGWSTENLAVYVFVLSADKRKASGTVYVVPTSA